MADNGDKEERTAASAYFDKVLEPLVIQMYDPHFMENCAVRGVQSYVVGRLANPYPVAT